LQNLSIASHLYVFTVVHSPSHSNRH